MFPNRTKFPHVIDRNTMWSPFLPILVVSIFTTFYQIYEILPICKLVFKNEIN